MNGGRRTTMYAWTRTRGSIVGEFAVKMCLCIQFILKHRVLANKIQNKTNDLPKQFKL